MSQPVIVADNLTKYFGSRPAVHDLSLSIPRGCVLGFLGRNGSGKTTTLRMLLGLAAPTRGSSTLLGHDSQNLPPEVRAKVGYMAEAHPVVGWMTAAQSAHYQQQFFPRWNQRLFDAVISHFRIGVKTKAGDLSRGQRAGLSLAMTLAPEPELLILDDPALGLDPVARRSLLEAMLYFTRSAERTIVFSSHILADVERVADHVAIMDQSVLRACCPIEHFRGRVREYVLRFEQAPPNVPPTPGLLRVLRFERELRLTLANGDDGGRAQTLLASLAAGSVEERTPSMEEQILAFIDDRGERTFFLETLGETR